MELATNAHHMSGHTVAENVLRSEVKGQGHDQTECYFGRGMHFDFPTF